MLYWINSKLSGDGNPIKDEFEAVCVPQFKDFKDFLSNTMQDRRSVRIVANFENSELLVKLACLYAAESLPDRFAFSIKDENADIFWAENKIKKEKYINE